MWQRKASLITAILGIIAMVLSRTAFTYASRETMNNELFLKENLVSLTKKCYLEGNCKNGKITISKLKEKGYINDTMKEKLIEYKDDSYIMYPSLEVELNKIDKDN